MTNERYPNKVLIRKCARKLRKNMTDSERLLWNYLRNRRFYGLKFLRQHPIIYRGDCKGIKYFIADFYCDEKKSVIELDGPIHDFTIEYDEFRNAEMTNLGLKILRFKNEELSDIGLTLEKLKNFLIL